MSSKNRSGYLIFFIPFIIGWLFLSVKAQAYNRFTTDSPPTQAGVLNLKNAAWSDRSRYFLSSGWAFYQERYLTPENLKLQSAPPTTYLTPGNFGAQYVSAYSAGTYRLTVLLPPESRQYALEVPRIGGNYQIWVNGQCYVDTISAQTVNASLTVLLFDAANLADIVIIANSMSHYQCGLLQPPAFGGPVALWTLMTGQLFAGSAAFVLALVLVVVFLIVALNSPKRREGLCRTYLCLCYAGCVSWVPIRMLSLHGGFFHVLYIVSFYGMLATFFLLLQAACQMPRKWHYTVCILALTQYVIVVSIALSPFWLNSDILLFMGWIGQKYFLAAFISLVCFTWWSLRHGYIQDKFLIAGAGVIAAALLNMAVYRHYQPIFFYWPLELGIFILIILIGYSNTRDLINLYIEKLQFQERAQAARRLIIAENQKYKALLAHLDNLMYCKHEMRSRLITLLNLSRAGTSSDLELQILEYIGYTEYRAYCSHNLLNALLSSLFTEDVLSRILFKYEIVGVPKQLPLKDVDLCSLISNILENAIEGCERLLEGADKWVSCRILVRAGHLYISSSNTCPDDIVIKNGHFVSSKPESQSHGYGMRYIEMCVTKYAGLFQVNHGNGCFTVEIAIPVE